MNIPERPLDPEDFEALFSYPEPDEDAEYERVRQQEIDDEVSERL